MTQRVRVLQKYWRFCPPPARRALPAAGGSSAPGRREAPPAAQVAPGGQLPLPLLTGGQPRHRLGGRAVAGRAQSVKKSRATRPCRAGWRAAKASAFRLGEHPATGALAISICLGGPEIEKIPVLGQVAGGGRHRLFQAGVELPQGGQHLQPDPPNARRSAISLHSLCL